MNKITKKLLSLLSCRLDSCQTAYSLREDGTCAGLQSTKHVQITARPGNAGIDILVKPTAKGETIYIPACITHSDIEDTVHNHFHIQSGAEITIVAGCGIHTDSAQSAQHNGIHHFFVEKGAKVHYIERHIGIGTRLGSRSINPQTSIELEENSQMRVDTVQIEGVDRAKRDTTATLAQGAKLIVQERLLTQDNQAALSDFQVALKGKGASTDLVSRCVAKGASRQSLRLRIYGDALCSGHSECDALLMEKAEMSAIPELVARHPEAHLIHEAAIGKIASEQILKLMTLGLTRQQAEARIIQGFLK